MHRNQVFKFNLVVTRNLQILTSTRLSQTSFYIQSHIMDSSKPMNSSTINHLVTHFQMSQYSINLTLSLMIKVALDLGIVVYIFTKSPFSRNGGKKTKLLGSIDQ
eukprot:NODE_320_length_9849_cov_0.608923.p6 type:complete len:105 gc:universal NODE_320_length_9849_cov_0.608923:3605-3291(-)